MGTAKRTLRALTASSLACAALSGRPAQAEVPIMAGAFLGFALGPREGFIWGFDARGWIIDRETSDDRGLGAFAKLTCLKTSSVDLAFGMSALGRADKDFHFAGDLGISWRLNATPAELGALHFGAMGIVGSRTTVAFTPLLQARVPWAGGPVEGAAAAGVLMHPLLPFFFLDPLFLSGGRETGGRPLRTLGTVARPRLLLFERASDGRRRNLRSPSSVAPCRAHHRRASSDSLNTALARVWRDDTSSECGSVPAFLTLARDPAEVGAPLELARRATQAAREEVTHTRLCASLAESYDGIGVAAPIFGPNVTGSNRAPGENHSATLTRLAIESWKDGCLAEGESAARARVACALTTEPRIRRALAIIARDEQRHAELGWSILEWSVRAGGSCLVEALREELRCEPQPAHFEDEGATNALALWSAHGRLNRPESVAIREHSHRSAQRRARKLLDANV